MNEYRFVPLKYFNEIFYKSRKNFLKIITNQNYLNKFKAIIVYDTTKINMNDIKLNDNQILFKFIDNDKYNFHFNNNFINLLESI